MPTKQEIDRLTKLKEEYELWVAARGPDHEGTINAKNAYEAEKARLEIKEARPSYGYSSTDPVYKRWLEDQGQMALVKDGDYSPTSPNFLGYKANRGPNGEWLSQEQIFQKEQAQTLKDQAALDEELRLI